MKRFTLLFVLVLVFRANLCAAEGVDYKLNGWLCGTNVSSIYTPPGYALMFGPVPASVAGVLGNAQLLLSNGATYLFPAIAYQVDPATLDFYGNLIGHQNRTLCAWATYEVILTRWGTVENKMTLDPNHYYFR